MARRAVRPPSTTKAKAAKKSVKPAPKRVLPRPGRVSPVE
jgi:hypothetical protein